MIVGCNTSVIPNDGSVTSIGNSAFEGCVYIENIEIPASVTNIGAFAFHSCNSLSLTVATGNPVYHSAGNCLIETATKTLVAGHGASVIPTDGSVTSIGKHAFAECNSLTSITIPGSVTSIGENAFSACSNLMSITISDGVTSIGESAFDYCRSLTNITIPNSVTSFGQYAFYYCPNLTSITYAGTKAQWDAISKGTDWNSDTGAYVIHCTDGDIAK